MANDPFAPLPGKGKPTGKSKSADDWAPLSPVPPTAPKPPSEHPKRGAPSRTWEYRSPSGDLLGLVCRFENPEGGKDILPLTFCENRSNKRQEWRWKGFAEPRPLYGLDRLAARPDAPVIVCEGEKDTDAAQRLLPGHVAVTSPSGSKSAAKASWIALHKRDVTIWPDADQPGSDYALAVARLLQGCAATISIATPPVGVPEGWGAADALQGGWDSAQALALIEAAKPAHEFMQAAHISTDRTGPDSNALGDEPEQEGGEQKKRRGPPQCDRLIAHLDGCDLWHDPDNNAFASIPINGHWENWPVTSRPFKTWLCGRHHDATGGAVGGQALQDALRVIEAKAIHHGPERPTFLRVGEQDGKIYIDLGGPDWRAVEVTANDGWRVIDKAPVMFLRPGAMRPLPVPEAGESVEQLRDLVNVRTEGDFKLLVAWLLGALHPTGPYPVLVVNGEQGSAKSTLSRLVRTLTDPSKAMIRAAPRDERDLLIAAKNSWVVVLDNMSAVPGWLSDGLCRLATGGGYATRELFTDWGETVFDGQRPVVLNGIPDLASRPDLADRAILLTLPAIPETERKSEREYNALLVQQLPYIMGALLDGLCGSLRDRGKVALSGKPRMADFAERIAAAESSLGWTAGAFMEAYGINREGAVETAIEADPVAGAVRAIVGDPDWQGTWQGTATELLEQLGKYVSEAVKRSKVWPAANTLKSRLRRLQAPLRGFGIVFDLDLRSTGHDRSRLICIRTTA